MSVLIKDVKVEMMQFGVNANTLPKRVTVCFPQVTVSYMDSGKADRIVFLDELSGRFKKSDYRGKVVCGEFFVLIFKAEWEIISPDGRLLASMQPCGDVIAADEDHFIVRNGRVITAYDIEGKDVGSRELTDEEIKQLDGR